MYCTRIMHHIGATPHWRFSYTSGPPYLRSIVAELMYARAARAAWPRVLGLTLKRKVAQSSTPLSIQSDFYIHIAWQDFPTWEAQDARIRATSEGKDIKLNQVQIKNQVKDVRCSLKCMRNSHHPDSINLRWLNRVFQAEGIVLLGRAPYVIMITILYAPNVKFSMSSREIILKPFLFNNYAEYNINNINNIFSGPSQVLKILL